MGRIKSMPPEERFTRTVFGIILILSAGVTWGKWVALMMGILFIFSAWQGYCVTCAWYKKFNKEKSKS